VHYITSEEETKEDPEINSFGRKKMSTIERDVDDMAIFHLVLLSGWHL